MCGLEVSLSAKSDNVDIVIKPDKNDPFSKGSMCPKAPALASLHTDSSRLRQPVKRVDGDWVEISWDEAYSTIEKSIKRIRDEHGADAVASYLGNPIVHNLGMMLFVKSLTEAIGSKNVFSATSMDQLPHHFAAHFMFGHEFRIPVPDVDRTDFMIIMGANPIASNGSIMTSAGIRERLRAIEDRGGQFVVLDPRLTETAKLASAHHFIKPGTDVFFLLAFLHVLYRDKLTNFHHPANQLSGHLAGLDEIERVAQSVTPLQAEALTGVPVSVIESLVHDYAKQERAVLYGRMGLSTQSHGGLCNWLINCINIVSGHFDRPGGMMFPSPAIELARGKSQQNRFGRWASRVRNMPEFYGELPVSAMTEEFTTRGPGQVRAFMTVCGNPVLSTPGGHRLDAALPDVDFMFSIDNYINETTRHANIILPTPSGLEIEHFDLIFNLISVANNVKFSEALLPPSQDTPRDWQVLKELITRLSPSGPSFLHRYMTPRRIINWGLMLGPYGKLSHPKRLLSGLSLKKVISSTHGIRLGPLVSRVPEGMMTPDKKIHLAPKVFTVHLKSLLSQEQFLALKSSDNQNIRLNDSQERPFSLIGRRHVSTNNSWMHQFEKLSRSRQVRCTVMINSEDANQLSIVDGESVRVTSDAGEISLPAEVTDTMMRGVVSIPHGFGHTRSGTRVPHAEAKPGVSVNDITDHNNVDELTGNAAFSGTRVSVEKIGTFEQDTVLSGKPLTVLYGSRTGNAEFAAQDIAKRAQQYGLLTEVAAMDKVEATELVNKERLLIVCSTYGEGDMPDNAQHLWDTVSAAEAPNLDGMFYSVLAFGDASYATFCEAGKQWDKRFEELGATRIANRIDCDVDYIDAADQWMESVLPAIAKVGDQTEIQATSQHLLSAQQKRYNRNNPLTATLLNKNILNANGSSKQTYHYILSLCGADVAYQVGDAINVLPVNRPSLVRELLALVGSEGHERTVGTDKSIHERLLHDLEIRIPSPALIEYLAEHANNLSTNTTKSPPAELSTPTNAQGISSVKLSTPASVNDRSHVDKNLTEGSFTRGKDIVELLTLYPDAVTNVETLIGLLRPITPRTYSISSSQNCHPDEVHLTVATVRYSSNGRQHHGVASGYLADQLNVGDTLSVYFAPNNSFTLPENDATPIIMIGPGTGIAPFRGFLQEREQRKAKGPSWLFFGDQHEESDFLYKKELETWLDQGVLHRLDVAFSRDQESKVYVQNRMQENAVELYRWLEGGAVVYVCGDAEHMAKDVDDTLRKIIQVQGNQSENQAAAYVKKLARDKRYLRDVY